MDLKDGFYWFWGKRIVKNTTERQDSGLRLNNMLIFIITLKTKLNTTGNEQTEQTSANLP